MTGDDLAERLAFAVSVLNRRLRPGPGGLTHVSLSALASIAREGALRPGDLARVEGIAAPAATRLVADLEQRGLVTRAADPEDGRSQLVRATATGRAALASARRDRADGIAAMLGDLSPADRVAVERTVALLEAALSGPARAGASLPSRGVPA